MIKISSILLVIFCFSYLELVESIDGPYQNKIKAVVDKVRNIYIIDGKAVVKNKKGIFGKVYNIFKFKDEAHGENGAQSDDTYHKRGVSKKTGIKLPTACKTKRNRKCREFCINGICRPLCRQRSVQKCRTLVG